MNNNYQNCPNVQNFRRKKYCEYRKRNNNCFAFDKSAVYRNLFFFVDTFDYNEYELKFLCAQ